MAITRKQLKKEKFQRIYFHYWKLQNNPEYIKFYKRETAFLKDFERNPKEAFTKVDKNFFIDSASLSKRLGLGYVSLDPFKKIDWKGLIDFDKVDLDIYRGLAFSPIFSPVKVEEWEPNDQKRKSILRLLIDISPIHDKKDILEIVSVYIDKWREIRKIEPSKSRDQINKFHIYAEIWDLRKGFPKKSFKEIARELKRPTPTVISQYRRAFELINGRPYEAGDHKAFLRSLIRKTTCQGCAQWAPCSNQKGKDAIPCPEVQMQLKELEINQAHKLDKHGKEKSNYELASDREAYRKWQEESE